MGDGDKTDIETLRRNLLAALGKIPGMAPGSRWRHYRGALYYVRGFYLHEATGEPCVLYRPDDGDWPSWGRRMAEWLDPVILDGRTVPRFTLQTPLPQATIEV